MSENKVQFGLKKFYYSKATVTTAEDGTESITYAAPVSMGPARSFKADSKADSEDYYADDVILDSFATMDGYDVEVAVTELPLSFKKDILNDVVDTNGVLLENPDGKTSPFALMFEFDGDVKARRHVFYYCKAERPSMEGSTSEGKVDPKEQTIKCTAKIAPGIKRIKASSTEDTPKTAYDAWYTAVQVPGEVTTA